MKPLTPLLFVTLASSLLGGCLTRDLWSGLPEDLAIPKTGRAGEQPMVERYSVLFVVDDSVSMADKQKVLAKAIEKARFVALECLGPDGPDGPVSPINGVCPEGYGSGGFSILHDALIITTSLEGGGEICAGKSRRAQPLEPSDGNSYAIVDDAGEDGCGFESPLEAMYRFLVDPEPPLSVTVTAENGKKETIAEGIDEELLARRAEFLAPQTFLRIVILTDEDDCSVLDSGDAWKLGEETIPRGTSTCEKEPENVCCRPCDRSEPSPPEGCAPLSEDKNCQENGSFDAKEAPLNTRCWNQKQRFGTDRLFPVERYTEALSSPTITNRRGEKVANPIFKYGATPDMVSMLLLTGVPWQLLTTPESQAPGKALEFLSPEQLEANDVWSKILGNPKKNVPPSDPHLIESVAPRPGLPLPETEWDPIHGHEAVWPREDSLQYSCIFALPEPEACTETTGCTCDARLGAESPLCRQEDGSYGEPQRFAGAFPPTRLTEFARSLGAQASLGSVCPKQLEDPKELGYGYDDFLHGALLNQRGGFHQACFTPSYPVNEDGTVKCKLLEFYRDQELDCAALGRGPVGDEYRSPFWLKATDRGTLCEIPRMPGDPSDQNSDYYRCAHDLHPSVESEGYCYIDTKLDLGSPELVAPCIASHKRFFRSIPAALARPGTELGLVCDYRK